MINMIACISRNRGIGYNGDLLFHLDVDMKLFKLMTTHATVIMGRKTYDSLQTKPLPNRTNVVLSSLMSLSLDEPQIMPLSATDAIPWTEKQQHGSLQHNHALGDPPETKLIYVNSMEELDKYVDEHIEDDLWIIGGQSLYEHFIERADKIILTEVDAEPKADTFFPMLDAQCCGLPYLAKDDDPLCEDYAIIKIKEGEEQGYHYVINIYQRLKPWLAPKEYNKEPENPCL